MAAPRWGPHGRLRRNFRSKKSAPFLPLDHSAGPPLPAPILDRAGPLERVPIVASGPAVAQPTISTRVISFGVMNSCVMKSAISLNGLLSVRTTSPGRPLRGNGHARQEARSGGPVEALEQGPDAQIDALVALATAQRSARDLITRAPVDQTTWTLIQGAH